MSDGSDIEIRSAPPKKTTKKPKKRPTVDLLQKQDTKKITTKEMIHQALADLKTRKGTSLYAIKKYIEEKYQVDIEKMNYLIKKYLKISVEAGTIVKTKGVGAAGSFKLVPDKEKIEKKKNNNPKREIKITEKPEKTKEKASKPSHVTKQTNKNSKPKENNIEEVEISKTSSKSDKKDKSVATEPVKKKKKTKMIQLIKTPAKKRAAMIKRKSTGSIIKPPKMRPKAK